MIQRSSTNGYEVLLIIDDNTFIKFLAHSKEILEKFKIRNRNDK